MIRKLAEDIPPARFGTKAHNLSELRRITRIPDGIAISYDATPQDINEAVHQLSDSNTYCVRSSALGEDLTRQSFAGMYDSYCKVPQKDLYQRIQDVRASAQSKRVAAYGTKSPVGVVIQHYISCEQAGVIFTKNPVTQDPQQMIIEYCSGSLEKLVSGRITPETFIHDKQTIPEQFTSVIKAAKRIERYFGTPQDIEWGVAGQKLYIFQARPITS